MGICNFDKSLKNYEAWIELADQALYFGKENGRNQTTIAKITDE
jgi:diguanylate cyclase